jgi:hypothetical protein
MSFYRNAVRDGLSSLQSFSGDDILAALGLEKRRSYSSASALVPPLAIFTAGALVGAAAAVLLTPKTGPQMRRELSDGARDLQQKLSSTAQEYTGQLRQGNATSQA